MSRAERRHRTAKVVAKRVRQLAGVAPDHPFAKCPHKAHKRKPLDCGKPGCGCCHSTPKGRPQVKESIEC